MQGALQGVGEVEHRIVHQYFDVLGEVASVRSPEGLVQLWKPPAQAAQDLADRVAVLEGLVIDLARTTIAADKFGDPGNNLDLHLASSSSGWHIRCGHVQLLSPIARESFPQARALPGWREMVSRFRGHSRRCHTRHAPYAPSSGPHSGPWPDHPPARSRNAWTVVRGPG